MAQSVFKTNETLHCVAFERPKLLGPSLNDISTRKWPFLCSAIEVLSKVEDLVLGHFPKISKGVGQSHKFGVVVMGDTTLLLSD